MKNLKILFIVLFILKSIYCLAQHCPFDGYSIILIKTNNAINYKTKINLHEINNPKVSNCSYSNTLIKKSFMPIDSIYNDQNWVSDYEIKEGVSIKDIGDFYVFLSSAQVNCMLKNGNNFNLKKRNFAIKYRNYKTKKIKIEVDSTMIYSLCTAKNRWQNIKAIILEN